MAFVCEERGMAHIMACEALVVGALCHAGFCLGGRGVDCAMLSFD
jgi:hypothetical protein